MSENTETQIVKKPASLKDLLTSDDVRARLEDILGKRASTFATSVLQITQQNTMLQNAVPSSIVGAAMTSATLNLPLNNNLGYAYIIPFNERQKDGSSLVKAQFQIGYKGFIQLAMRSGQFKTIHTTDVKDGEIIGRNRLSGEIEFNWIEDDAERLSKNTVGYVAYFKLINGFEATFYMTMTELNGHGKKFSQTFKKDFGLWKDDFDSMAKKTVLKLLLSKYAPMSIEMQTAKEIDQASLQWNEEEKTIDTTYIDNDEVKIDVELERITGFLNDAQTQEDLDLIKPQISEEYLPLFKEAQKRINGKNPINKNLKN